MQTGDKRFGRFGPSQLGLLGNWFPLPVRPTKPQEEMKRSNDWREGLTAQRPSQIEGEQFHNRPNLVAEEIVFLIFNNVDRRRGVADRK